MPTYLPEMQKFVDQLKASNNAVEVNSIESLATILGLNMPQGGPFNDPSILKLLNECLHKAGAPPNWKSLRKHTKVNGKPLPESEVPPDYCFYEDGQYFQQFKRYILWQGLTIDQSEHCNNHSVKIYRDGRVEGSINGFAFGDMPVEASYLTDYLTAWLGRIKEKPYWDEVDGKRVGR